MLKSRHTKVDAGCPPIKAILFNQEDIMRLRSLDHVAYNENLRKRVPTDVLVDKFLSLIIIFLYKTMG